MYNPVRIILAMTTLLVTGALSSCNHADELEPVSLAPQIVFSFFSKRIGAT
jgi:basic membrane protein A